MYTCRVSYTWQSVVTCPLEVQGHEVHTGAEWRFLREEAPCDLLSEELVVRLGRLLCKAPDERIHSALSYIVHLSRTMERLPKEKTPS